MHSVKPHYLYLDGTKRIVLSYLRKECSENPALINITRSVFNRASACQNCLYPQYKFLVSDPSAEHASGVHHVWVTDLYLYIFCNIFLNLPTFSYLQYLIRKITHFQLKSSVHAGNLQPIMSGNLPPRLNQFNWYIKPFFFSILRYLQRILLIVNLKQHINPNLDFLSLKLKSYNIIRCFASSIRQCIILTSK